jgi:hypothetical protein
MPVIAHDFERAFAIDFFLQSTQCLIYGFAFFQLNFCQTNSLPLQKTREEQPPWLRFRLSQGCGAYFQAAKSQPAKFPNELGNPVIHERTTAFVALEIHPAFPPLFSVTAAPSHNFAL